MHGFTILGLLTALGIVAILLSVGLPSFDNIVGNDRIAIETTRLVANLSYARSEAFSRRSVITMKRASTTAKDWSQGWEIYTDDDSGGNSNRKPTDTLLRDIGISNGVTINVNASANRWISYKANGMLNEGGPLVIAVCDDRDEVAGQDINVSLTGHVSISTPSISCTP